MKRYENSVLGFMIWGDTQMRTDTPQDNTVALSTVRAAGCVYWRSVPIAAPTAVLPAVVLRPTTGMEQPTLSVDRVYSCKEQRIPL